MPHEVTLSTPDVYHVGDKVLFTARGKGHNRTGIINRDLSTSVGRRYEVRYSYWLPTQRRQDGTRPVPTPVLCTHSQLTLVHDDVLSVEEFLKLTPLEVLTRYLS